MDQAKMKAQREAMRSLIKEMLRATDLKASELARRAGLAASTLTRFMNKDVKHNLSLKSLYQLSGVSGIPVPAVIATGETGRIPVVGVVGAGEQIYPIDDGPRGAGLDYVDAPAGIPPDCVAVRVHGTSMFPAYWDGDLLIYRRDYDFIRDICLYNECIVKVLDGPTYIKRIMPGSSEGRYSLLSYNAPAIMDVRIEWAAPVMIHDKRRRRAKAVEVA